MQLTGHTEINPDDADDYPHDLMASQRIRFMRFLMAVATYGIVCFAIILTTRLGLGILSIPQWLMIIGIALFGNIVFMLLFYLGMNLRFKDPSLTQIQIVYSAFWGMFILYWLPNARPIILMFYIPAFSFGMLRLNRREYLIVSAWILGMYAGVLLLEFFRGRPDFKMEYELFVFVIFSIILSWTSFFGGFVSNIRNRLKKKNLDLQKAHDVLKIEMVERQRAQNEKDKLIAELQLALGEVKTLSGLLPICASCKNIRDDKGYWNQIETYISDHSEAIFSHGICPDCTKKLYPNINIHSERLSNNRSR